MNTITITTSQNIELEYELGSLGDRILGAIIDWVVLIAYVIIVSVIISVANLAAHLGGYVFVVIVLMLPIVFYDLLCETLLNGQSLGKKVMGLKVISLSGQQPSFSQYLNRWIFRLVDFTFTSNMLAVIMVAVTEKKQRLGDLIAGTVLVKIKPRTGLNDTWYHATDTGYAVTYPEVINLRDQDIQLIKEVIISVSRSGNTMLSLEAQRKVEDILNIKSKHEDPRVFLQVVLADYNYLTSQM